MRALGFVLVGGQSVRMGQDKASLAWHDGTLLDHAVSRLRSLCDEVVLLGGSDRPLKFERLDDAWPGAGPLGALLTALERVDEQAALVLPVDAPFATKELLAGLLRALDDADAAVPLLAGGPEPLVAAYRSSCREPVRRRLARGERKATCFWPDVRVRTLGDTELRAFGDPQRMFLNVNTPADYQAALELADSPSPDHS